MRRERRTVVKDRRGDITGLFRQLGKPPFPLRARDPGTRHANPEPPPIGVLLVGP
jgi:hypothetical protein